MKRLLIFILSIALFAGCASDKAKVEPQTSTHAEIEQSVREFLSNPHPDESGATEPPVKVYGITVNQRFQDLYVVGADVETPGGKRTITVIARKYTGEGKTYWKTQPYNYRLVQSLKNEQDEN